MSLERPGAGKDLHTEVLSTTAPERDEGTDSSLLELTRGLEEEEKGDRGGGGGEKESGKAVKVDTMVPPPTPQSGISILAHKIWIGNLDKRLSQDNVLRFVNRYGSPVSFRFYFKAGTDMMEPRGYCFVEYSTREEAEKAKAALDGKLALGKRIVVDWARYDPASKKNVDSVSETWDPSVVSDTLDRGVSTSAKIAALEAKLRAMKEGKSSSTVLRVNGDGQKPWNTERKRTKRTPDSRIITRPQKRGRTHILRSQGPLI